MKHLNAIPGTVYFFRMRLDTGYPARFSAQNFNVLQNTVCNTVRKKPDVTQVSVLNFNKSKLKFIQRINIKK
jgi:hypothetical protein